MRVLDHDSSAFLSTYQSDLCSSSLESNATFSSLADSTWSASSSQSSADTSPSSESDPCDSYTTARTAASCAPALRHLSGAWPTSVQRTDAALPNIAAASSVPAELRQNPRRSGNATARCPPSLVRQCDRKVNFVDSLVDSSTQIVEAIWPLSSVVCRSDIGNKAVLPLRTFIQETLRRSRTSYSTLQVALYYLILIKPHVPKHDFTMEQPDDRQECRALQCGRRMFLAALILASKYLQDRNYSARAWSKISGLATHEINQNELTFLLAVNWKLHITDEVFQRWTDIVFKHTPPPPPSPGAPSALYVQQSMKWKRVILLLNPQLDNLDGLLSTLPDMSKPLISTRNGLASRRDMFTGPMTEEPLELISNVKPSVAPSTIEPSLDTVYTAGGHAPALGLLPTPRLTPQLTGYSTPAASAASHILNKGSAMWFAVSQASNAGAAQTLDRYPTPMTSSPQSFVARRSSLATSVSTASSPESMVSDTSRTSRSSSISSASSLVSAPAHKLGVQARFRCAKLVSERTCLRPTISSVPEDYEDECMTSSPDSYTGPVGKIGDLSLETPLGKRERDLDESDAARALQALQNYHHAASTTPVAQLSRKRSHPEFLESSMLQSNVRDLLYSSKTSWDDALVRPRASMVPRSVGEVSPRKRVCCSAEAAAGFRNQTLHHPAGGYTGPGMWEGILN